MTKAFIDFDSRPESTPEKNNTGNPLKEKSETLNYVDLEERFSEGGVLILVESQENGFRVYKFLPYGKNHTYLVIIPPVLQRRHEVDGKILCREEGDENFSLGEVFVSITEKTTSESIARQRKMVQRFIKKSLEKGIFQGPEFEFSCDFVDPEIPHNNIFSILEHAIEEAFPRMREVAPDNPLEDIDAVLSWLKEQLKNTFKKTEDDGITISMLNMWPETAENGIGNGLDRFIGTQDEKSIPDKKVFLQYVDLMKDILSKSIKKMVENPSEEEQETLKILKPLVEKYGYNNPEDFLSKVLVDVWSTMSLHFSLDMPQNQRTGKVPEGAAKSVLNLQLHFSELLLVNNFSGNMVSGVPLNNSEGQTLLSARSAIAPIVPLARPAGKISHLIPKSMEHVRTGRAANTTRGMGEIHRTNPHSGATIIEASYYGNLRFHGMISAQDFLAGMTTNNEKTFLKIPGLARVENVSRDLTPEILGGNMYSVGLQNTLHIGGLMAFANPDFMKKLSSLGIDIENESGENDSHERFLSQNRANTGIFDKNKIKQLTGFIRLVEEYMNIYTSEKTKHWDECLVLAQKALYNIRMLAVIIHDSKKSKENSKFKSMSASDKYDYFKKHKLGVWGLTSLLSDKEIYDILTQKMKITELFYGKDKAQLKKISDVKDNRGALINILGHFYTLQSLD